jgi:hypothetical protein
MRPASKVAVRPSTIAPVPGMTRGRVKRSLPSARPVGAGGHLFGGEVGHGHDAGLGDEAPPVPLGARDQLDRQVGAVAVVPDRVQTEVGDSGGASSEQFPVRSSRTNNVRFIETEGDGYGFKSEPWTPGLRRLLAAAPEGGCRRDEDRKESPMERFRPLTIVLIVVVVILLALLLFRGIWVRLEWGGSGFVVGLLCGVLLALEVHHRRKHSEENRHK